MTTSEAQGAVVALILAAGTSSRMGEPKLLLSWEHTTVLGRVLLTVQASAVDQLLVVTGDQSEAVAAVAAAHGVQAVYNPAYRTGEMLSSLQCGLRHLPTGCAAVLVVLADQPLLRSATIDRLLAAYRNGAGTLVAPTYAGQRGNPVLIDRRFFAELLELSSGSAPRALLRKYPADVALVPVDDEGVLLDIDSPEAYDNLRPKGQ